MEPQRNANATLVDLLDRVLDKGLVIHADLIVSVVGIPLIGVNLRAALAGMETMLKYGMMQAWDERIRLWEKGYRSKKESSLIEGKEIILKMLGAYHLSEGIYTAWRYGQFYLTTDRLLLYHGEFGEILFETPLEKIKALVIREGRYFTEKEREELCLLLEGNKVARLAALDVDRLKDAIDMRMQELGFVLEQDPALPVFEEGATEFLTEEEQVICRGKMWYLMDAEGITDSAWSPGHLYLSEKRLCWCYDFGRGITLEIPIGELVASAMEIRDLSGALKKKKALDVIYAVNGTRRVASFSGDALEEWDQILKRIITGQGESPFEEETDTCPQCARTASIKELLGQGCPRCGWVSRKTEKAVVSG